MSTPRPGRPVRGSRTGHPLNAAFDLLGRRWALRVLWELRAERLSFRLLQERCGGISPTVLNQRLAELRETGLIEAVAEGGYELTVLGRELGEALAPLQAWAVTWNRAQFGPSAGGKPHRRDKATP